MADSDETNELLREIREPTSHMIDRAGAQDDHTTQYVQCESADVHWRAMIDAALNEAPAHTSSELGHG